MDLNLKILKDLPPEQFEAAKEIISRGGQVWLENRTGKPPVEVISFRGEPFTDSEISLLWPFRGVPLYSIGFNQTKLSSRGVTRVLKEFTTLKGLVVSQMAVGDSAFAPLERFRDLEHLAFDQTQVTSDVLVHAGAQLRLQHLGLSGTQVDDSGFKYLERLSELKWLSAGETKITSAALSSVGKLTSLETLTLNDTHVDDRGLEHLTSLKYLKTLRLDGALVTDTGMAHVAKLLSISTLNLERTKVGAAGLGLLHNMPNLKEVRWDGAQDPPGTPRRRFNSLFHLHLPANATKWSKTRRDAIEAGKRDL